MAAPSKRVLWKGAISFGLVHIPIALHSATQEQSIDFDWLDKRSMDPVGYKRINKATGKEIASENIVKGIEYEEGQYVVLSREEIAAAYPKTTQTVEIEAFVPLEDIPFVYLDRPYYTSPINRGAKVYALLREVLRKTNKVGIAKVVIQTKQHLALLLPCGPALILNLLRWDDEIRSWEDLNLPAAGTGSTGLTDKEMAMGEQLVEDMSRKWQPEAFTDSFREQILQLVKDKVEAGEVEAVGEPEAQEAEPRGAKILDLTEMLRRSLDKGAASGKAPAKSRSVKRASGPQAEDRSTSGKAAGKDAGGAAGKTGRKAAPSPSGAAAKAAGGKTARAKATKKPAGSGRKAA